MSLQDKKNLKLVSASKMKEYVQYGETLEGHYKEVAELDVELKKLKEEELKAENKIDVWTRIDIVNSKLRDQRRLVKWDKQWLLEFVTVKEPIRLPYIRERDERYLEKDTPLRKGYVWKKSAYPCTRCGHPKWTHEYDDGTRVPCEDRLHSKPCKCPLFSSNKKYPYAKPETCPHDEIMAYGRIENGLRVFCQNHYCGTELTDKEEGKKKIEYYTARIWTKEEWKKETEWHKDFRRDNEPMILIEITKGQDDYIVNGLESLCPECYSKDHDIDGHYKQSYEDMVKSYNRTIERFEGK